MLTLNKTLRSQLEKKITEARRVAEKAARAALEQLDVEKAAPLQLSEEERRVRHRLRAHGRQLGDTLNTDETQTLDHLVEEIAYEHWHRMLFARFLVENNVLLHPEAQVPVTLEECEELAGDEGAANGWELAARYATQMLPQIFPVESPVFALVLPPEYQQKLEQLATSLPQDVFHASDSLGWIYQYWQAENKKRINGSGVKIGAEELPAVTQLFTEAYMVHFLLDNSLGAWWAARRLSADALRTAQCEEELRQKAAIPGVPLDYLRFTRDAQGVWTPAAGTFADWPAELSKFKLLDPCCGSGHFLVGALLMLVPLRMATEALSPQEAVCAVLRENLHGLELDQRCVKLAAFALAFAAWTYREPCKPAASFGFAGSGGTGFGQGTFASEPVGYCPLPELNLACSGQSLPRKKEQWTGLAQPNTALRNALDILYDEFRQAPTLGSLLSPSESIASRIAKIDLTPLLQQTLATEEEAEVRRETAVMARGITKAVALLAEKYTLVITNVPYLARGRQGEILRTFCEQHYPEAKNELATVFLERCLQVCAGHGAACIVMPQNWLFLTSYKKFREKLLKGQRWRLLARLGAKAFTAISGEIVNVILLLLSHGNTLPSGGLFGTAPVQWLHGLDVAAEATAEAKANALQRIALQSVDQAKQLNNPDARVAFGEENSLKLLNNFSYSFHGLTTGDMPRMKSCFWEVSYGEKIWIPFQSTVEYSQKFSGNEALLRWDNGQGALNELQGARKDGLGAWGKHGILVSQMRDLSVTLYNKFAFDNNAATIIPHDPAHLPALWCYCSSPEYHEAVREIDQSLKVTNATLVKVPFDLERWQNVAKKRYPHGLPQPYSDDPAQWIFHGHPCGSVIWDDARHQTVIGALRTDESVLQIAVARLLGYRWPAELDESMELAAEQRDWVERCKALLPLADADGIVCISSVRGEAPAADRLLDMLATAYGDAWSTEVLTNLLDKAGHAGKTLDSWLREKFFTQHCKRFQNRPFIWHIWDGLRDGFAALVNYHTLDHKNLETLIYTYLGDWITRQKNDIEKRVDGAREKLAAAENLKKSLELILKGEAPYDIFVRWKPLAEQALGWNPDINDGVRLNIRPFLTVPDVGRKGAGILRDKPNIKWDKDRGKDMDSSPWFSTFHGDRINDHHLTLAEKRQAREGKESSA